MFSRARSLAALTVGVMLCTAISASAAFGSEFHFEKISPFIQGSSSVVMKFGPAGNKTIVNCPAMDLTGQTKEIKWTPKITLHPSLTGGGTSCKISTGTFWEKNATATVPAACNFDLTLPSEGTTANMAIVGCTAGAPIKVVGVGCTVEVPNQSGLSGVSMTNEGAGKTRALKAGFALTTVKATLSGCGNGNGTFSTGEFTATPTLRGYVAYPEQQMGIWVE